MGDKRIEMLFEVLPQYDAHILRDNRNILEVVSDGADDSWDKVLRKISHLSLKSNECIYNKIFSGSSIEKSKTLAHEYIDENGLVRDATNSLTYGEIEFFSFVHILQWCQPRKGEKFVDLGHGTGRCLVAASLLYGDVFSSIHGIELIPALFHESTINILTLKAIMAEEHSNGKRKSLPSISLELGDFLVNSACWKDAGTWPAYDHMPQTMTM